MIAAVRRSGSWIASSTRSGPFGRVGGHRRPMAQPFTTDPPGGAAERQALLATKFHVPRAGVVPRPRLVKRLARMIGGGLTLVCTPAGFGKSTLLGDFARKSRRPTAWLSLDDEEND